MIEKKKTNLPWSAAPTNPAAAIDKNGAPVFRAFDIGYSGAEITSYIVDRVNACAGLSNDAVDGGWNFLEMINYTKSLEAALREIIEIDRHAHADESRATLIARAALIAARSK